VKEKQNMKIKTTIGTMSLDDDAKPSIDDMNDIISSVTRDDDNGVQFQALCDASVEFDAQTNSEFLSACKRWLARGGAM